MIKPEDISQEPLACHWEECDNGDYSMECGSLCDKFHVILSEPSYCHKCGKPAVIVPKEGLSYLGKGKHDQA